MRNKLIAAIREVPISQTYEEYVECLVDRLEIVLDDTRDETIGEIIKDLADFLDDNKKEMLINGHGVWFINADDVTEFIAELKKKYIGKDTNVTTNTEVVE
jgi:hypothetical protein